MSEENFIRLYQSLRRVHDETSQLTDIILPNLLSNLDIGAIYDSKSAISHTNMKFQLESYQQSPRATLHLNRTSYSTFLRLQFQQSRYAG